MNHLKTVGVAALTAALFTLPAAPAAAQAGGDAATAPETELRELAAESGAVDRARDVLRDFLDQPAVADAAGTLGVDVQELRGDVATLSDTEASELAARVESSQDQDDMVGGDTFTISSTLVIIILLVAILIAVA